MLNGTPLAGTARSDFWITNLAEALGIETGVISEMTLCKSRCVTPNNGLVFRGCQHIPLCRCQNFFATVSKRCAPVPLEQFGKSPI